MTESGGAETAVLGNEMSVPVSLGSAPPTPAASGLLVLPVPRPAAQPSLRRASQGSWGWLLEAGFRDSVIRGPGIRAGRFSGECTVLVSRIQSCGGFEVSRWNVSENPNESLGKALSGPKDRGVNSLEGKARFPLVLSRSLFVQRLPGTPLSLPLRQMAVISPNLVTLGLPWGAAPTPPSTPPASWLEGPATWLELALFSWSLGHTE